MQEAHTQPKVSIQARVFRIDWAKRPGWMPKALFLFLAKRQVQWTGRWENLGEIASSERGTASVQFAHN